MLQNSKHGKRRMPIMHLSLSTLLLMAPLSLMASPLEGHRVADINEAMMAQQQSSKVNQRTITGTVTDANGEPIVGATVVEHGKKSGTITNGDGKFTLTVTPGNTLTISYVGFATQTVKARDAMRVTMTEDAQGLDEVVVVGYGTMKKRDLTGAVSSVKGTDLAVAGVASAAHMLAGKAAGLYVRQNSAQPGGGLDILIRGAGSVNASNDPLYIVDGFPIAKLDQQKGNNDRMDPGTQGVLNFLNPNDVESIEVLKDASATAIYGSRAANGVVIVTTKRGREGKAIVNYSYNYSYQHYSDKYDMLSLHDWMIEKNKASWEYWIWENNVGPWGSRTLEEALAAPKSGLAYTRPYTDAQIEAAGKGTDWVGLITRNGRIQEHNLSIQGGSKDTQYMISLNYYDNEGIIKNSGMTRYTVKSNIDQRFLNIFKTGVNLTLTRIDNDNTQLGSKQYEKSGIIRSAVQMGPNILAYDPVRKIYPVNPLLGTQPNPYSLLNNVDQGRTDRLLGNIYVEARPIDGLMLKLNAGLDRANISRKTYEPKTTLSGKNLQGNANIYTTDNNQYLLEATATYSKTFKEMHKLNLLAGTSFEQFNVESSNAGNNNFLFLNNRILASVEFYHRVISDLLNYKPLNYYHDISSVMANIGKTQSTGLEITINTTNVKTRDFKWTTNLTFTTYKDRWKERTPDWKPAVYEKVDDPIRPIYSRRADHILQIGEAVPAAQPDLRPGELVIKDLNGYKRDANGQPEVDANGRFILTGGPDGKIDDADVELIGSQDPGWMAGMVNTFNYKDFDLSFQLNGMFDRRMEDPTEMTYGLGGGELAQYGYNALTIIKKRWTWDNPSTKYPCSFNGWNTTYTHGDWYYQNAWFVRLSNITLGWNMPKAWVAKTKYISRVHLSLSASNLFCLTPYKGLDPETDYYTAAYPNARTYSIGVNITF